jgi:hypothetical protein
VLQHAHQNIQLTTTTQSKVVLHRVTDAPSRGALLELKQLGRSTHYYNNKHIVVYLELGVQFGAADRPGRRLIPVILHVT